MAFLRDCCVVAVLMFRTNGMPRLQGCKRAAAQSHTTYGPPSLRAGTPCSHAKILNRRMGSWVSIRRIRNIRILGLSGWA